MYELKFTPPDHDGVFSTPSYNNWLNYPVSTGNYPMVTACPIQLISYQVMTFMTCWLCFVFHPLLSLYIFICIII